MPIPDMTPEERREFLRDQAQLPPPSDKARADMNAQELARFERWLGRPASHSELALRRRRLLAAQFGK